MTLASAASDLCSDLSMLQARLIMEGYPVRARILNCGTSGRPGGRHAQGVFVRFDANGEEYVFTVTGPTAGIERYLAMSHENLQRMLARHWPARPEVEDALHDLGDRLRGGDTTASGALWMGPSHDKTVDMDVIAGYDEQEVSPRHRRAADRSLLHRHTFSIQRRPDGLWTACVCIPTPQGDVHLCATADEHAVAQALQGELTDVSGGRIWAGHPAFRQACEKVGEERAMDRLGSALRSMVRDPGVQSVFSSIVPFVPVVGPPAALAFEGAKMAVNITDKLQKGDPETTQKVRQVVTKAKQGDQKSIKFLKMLKLGQEYAKQNPVKPDPKIAILEAENKELRLKLAACEAKWKEKPEEAADDYTDLFGGGDEFVGPDIIQAAGNVIGAYAAEASGDPNLAKPMISRYYQERLPMGDVKRRDGSPEVGALYHRPMRESSDASLRRDYLRGTSLQSSTFQSQRRELIPGWGRTGAPR